MAQSTLSAVSVVRSAVKLLPSLPGSLHASASLALLQRDGHQSIGRMLEQQASKTPEKVFLRFENEYWNYRDFNAWVNRIAHTLAQQGVRRGTMVALMFANCPDVLACVAAVAKLGAVAGMLNPNQQGVVLRHSLSVLRAQVVIVGEEHVTSFASADIRKTNAMRWFWVGASAAPAGMIDLPTLCKQARVDNPSSTLQVQAKDPCFHIFTSGTTGMPKAAVMTHSRWLRCGHGMGRLAMRMRASDTLYCALPLYHNNALTLAWSSVLASGATLALARKFSASRFIDEVRVSHATAFVYIGEMCRYLLKRAPDAGDRQHALRVAVGNGLMPEIWDEFQQRFGVEHLCEFYSSSEGNLAFVNALGLPHTAGFSLQRYAIVVFDVDTDCAVRTERGLMQRVNVGDVGLLLTEVTQRNPFDGYADKEATEAKLLRDVFKRGDVWINSGDLVRELGMKHIAFVDRVGDTFRWKGENVATTEVEHAVASIDGVALAAVYGVSVPHANGRAGMVAITLAPGACFDAVRAAVQLSERLPAYAVPLFVRLTKEPPLTATFKVQKSRLKEQGFDPASVSDPLYVLSVGPLRYEPLTQQKYQSIVQGARLG